MAVKQKHLLGAIKDRCLEAVFPRFCVRCKGEGSLLCDDCFSSWHRVSVPAKDGAIASFWYADAVAHDLIRAWKYHFDVSAWDHLQRALRTQLDPLKARAQQVEAIVPVPLYHKRLCERGFDQAQMLAVFLSNELNIPVVHALERVRSTGKQAERSEQERKRLTEHCPFRQIAPVPQQVLLVDDVWTTGSTMRAAAQALMSGTSPLFYTMARG